MFRPGANSGCEERVWEAIELASTTIPLLSLLIKDHKPVKGGRPASRPVCGASRSINGELSEMLSTILEAVSSSLGGDEVISGEELRSMLDDVALEIRDSERGQHGLCVGSVDVNALYPSLEIKQCAKICAERVRRSPLKFEDIDYHWATVYLALNMSREEVIREDMGMLVPIRRATQGKDPTVLSVETDEKIDRWKWALPVDCFNEEDKKRIMARLVQVMVEATFQSHHYKWNSNVYKQEKGGP